jgi:hypothetical protein
LTCAQHVSVVYAGIAADALANPTRAAAAVSFWVKPNDPPRAKLLASDIDKIETMYDH